MTTLHSFFPLGGWTAIQKIIFTESNLRLEDDQGFGFKGLSNYSDHRQTVPSKVLQVLKNEMGFKQLRFYCHKKKVGTVFHIMTNINPQGEAVVEYLIGDNLISTRPQACGSYTVLPDDNSTLSRDCSKLGWNGTHADGKWAAPWFTAGGYRLRRVILARNFSHQFKSQPKERCCDDWNNGEESLSPGDTWAVFVR